jgi:hypothetical protein
MRLLISFLGGRTITHPLDFLFLAEKGTHFSGAPFSCSILEIETNLQTAGSPNPAAAEAAACPRPDARHARILRPAPV